LPFIVQKVAGKQSLVNFVPGGVLRIGRGTNAELRFDDVAVALEHAVIEQVGGGYRLLDRGSVTGTYLNGKPVREALLAANDLINIGSYQIRVQVTDPEDPLFLSVRSIAVAPPPPAEKGAMQRAAAEAGAVGGRAAGAATAAAAAAAVPPAPLGAPAPRAAAAPAPAAAGPPPGAASSAAPPAAVGAPPPVPEAAGAPSAAAPAAGAAPPASVPFAAAPPTPAALPATPPAAAPAAAVPTPPSLRAPAIDYLGAYSLRRRFFNKALLAAVLTLGAAALLLSLAWTGKSTAFEPGRVHRVHADLSCASCHTPWRGPDPALCSDCHAKQQPETGRIHQARQAFTPSCTGCHPEHRGGERVFAGDDQSCVACHADLQVRPLAVAAMAGGASGGTPAVAAAEEPRFAKRVRGFAAEHPDFSITLPNGSRLPLAEAVTRRADPTPLRFDHQLHLSPTRLGQPVQLTCQSCHQLAGRGERAAAGGAEPAAGGGEQPAAGNRTDIFPVAYEKHCANSGCHPLTFDSSLPNERAPHAEPKVVRDSLGGVYKRLRAPVESLRDKGRRLVRSQFIDFSPRQVELQVDREVWRAERLLYDAACKKCHDVDVNAKPMPRGNWGKIPDRWLPYSPFSHLKHQASACKDCHATAATSTVAADLLLPSIAVCRSCHGASGGGGGAVGAGTAPAAPADCVTCHSYHPESSPLSAAARAGRS
jgi:hypothetical protein